ncbi:DUF1378 family protein [Escherichia coli]|uniref:DUF1378 family protein n=1 Tax=Escherichia coli TaxID=562 RepID=UPI002096DE66|nr:DUF1378 family protein [Escherichia coli]
MTYIHQIMLYFTTAVCALYLVKGGYKVIRNYARKKIDEATQEKLNNKVQPAAPLVNNLTIP